jgi:hypothetical protein
MNFSPLHQKLRLSFCDNDHGTAQIVAFHPFSPDKTRFSLHTCKVHFGLTDAKDMNMRWLVIVCEDDKPKAALFEYRDHEPI